VAVCHRKLGFDGLQHAKFDHPSFSRSGDMVGVPQNVNGSRDLTMPIQGGLPSMVLSSCTKGDRK